MWSFSEWSLVWVRKLHAHEAGPDEGRERRWGLFSTWVVRWWQMPSVNKKSDLERGAELGKLWNVDIPVYVGYWSEEFSG